MPVNKVVKTRTVTETRVVLDLSVEQAEYLHALLFDLTTWDFEEVSGLGEVRVGLQDVCERKYKIKNLTHLVGAQDVVQRGW